MRLSAIWRACLFVSMCAACWSRAQRRDADGVALPVVRAAAIGATGGRTVKVTRDGRILFAGIARNTTELITAVAADGPGGSFELHADRDALWMHVQWVMAALADAGCTRVRCAVALEGGRNGFLQVPVYPGLWKDKFCRLNPRVCGATVVVNPVGAGVAEYHLWGLGGATRTRDPKAVRAWVEAGLDRIGEPARASAELAVEASGVVPYRFVAAAIAALQEAGAGTVEVGLEALHPWDRALPVLPAPPHRAAIHSRFVTDLAGRRLYPVNLPVASIGEQDIDDDPDDRVIVDLTATGRLILEGTEMSLAEFGDHLWREAWDYDESRRMRGRDGYERAPDGWLWSRLYVLLRADRDTPWRRVRWVMAELLDNRVYKLQLGVRKTRDRELTQAEAERRWAAWQIGWPALLDCKLACFLPTYSRTQHHRIEVCCSSAGYELRQGTTRDPEVLEAWLRGDRRRPLRGTVGYIRADPETPLHKIVVAINGFNRVRLEKVDFASIERAPAAVRHAVRMP